MASEVFRLGDLLDHHELGLELLSGGPGALGRRVSGAHSIEIEAPTRWLPEHWVMLTNGMRVRGAARAQRELIAEVDAGGIAALGFAVGTVFKQVPRALVEEARAREFPLFAIPLRVPFRDIITFVNRSLLSSEIRTLQRLSSIQRYLIDALHEPDPGQTLLDRVATVAGASAIVFDADGRVEWSSGKLPPLEDVWHALTRLPEAPQDLKVDGWHLHATPVPDREVTSGRWLVLTSPRAGVLTELRKPVAQAAAPLVAAVGWLSDAARAQERVVRQALLEDLLRLQPGDVSDAQLTARAAAYRVDFSSDARIVLAAPLPEAHGSLPVDAIAAELEALCGRLSAPTLVARRPGTVVALVQHDAGELLEGLEEVVEAHANVVVGLGRAFRDVAEASVSLRDAELAAVPLARQDARRLLDFEHLDLATLLVIEAPMSRIGPKVGAMLAKLRENSGIYDAVAAYLECDLNVNAAARALFLHPNSLRYRLSRAEELLGLSLKQPAAITALYIALIAEGSSRRETAESKVPSRSSASAAPVSPARP